MVGTRVRGKLGKIRGEEIGRNVRLVRVMVIDGGGKVD